MTQQNNAQGKNPGYEQFSKLSKHLTNKTTNLHEYERFQQLSRTKNPLAHEKLLKKYRVHQDFLGKQCALMTNPREKAKAQYNLAFAYEKGIPLLKDIDLAVCWYRKSAENNYGPAQHTLALLYMNGDGGVEKNESLAVQWCRQAADNEMPVSEARFNLARMYQKGFGCVQKNLQEAINYYTLASEQGSHKASYNLGCIYINREGFLSEKDNRETIRTALAYFETASLQGSKEALGAINKIYTAMPQLKPRYLQERESAAVSAPAVSTPVSGMRRTKTMHLTY